MGQRRKVFCREKEDTPLTRRSSLLRDCWGGAAEIDVQIESTFACTLRVEEVYSAPPNSLVD